MDPKLKEHLDKLLADLDAEDLAIKDLHELLALLASRSPAAAGPTDTPPPG